MEGQVAKLLRSPSLPGAKKEREIEKKKMEAPILFLI